MTTKEKREYVESILEEPHSLDPRTVEVLEEYLTRQWVSVSERLPDNDGLVLTYGATGEQRVLNRERGKRDWTLSVKSWHHFLIPGSSVTHWMPLPDEPKEDA